MMHTKSLIAVGLAVALLLIVPLALAQEDLDETYVSDDGKFTFDYPSSWDIEVDDNGTVTIWNVHTTMFIYPPSVIEDWNWGTDDPVEMLEGITAMWEEEGDQVGRVREIKVNGRPAAVATYVNEGYPGIFTVLTLSDGSLSATDTVGDEGEKEVLDADAETAEAITETVALARSSTSAGGGLVGALTGGSQSSKLELKNYEDDYRAVIEELRDLDLIESGGSLLFEEDYAWFEGYGSFYTPLAKAKNYRNFVMSGELQYTASGSTEIEQCTLGFHVVWSGNTTSAYGDIGIHNGDENYLYYYDVDNDGEQLSNGVEIDEKDLNDRHVFTLIVVDGELTLFVNGELLFAQEQIDDRAGSWGVGLNGKGSRAKCEARDVWVFTLP